MHVRQKNTPQKEVTYVWKKPKTPLDALREIVRALPLEPSIIDWREGIDGVVNTPKAKSVVTELSEEAKAILMSAASGDGRILALRHMQGLIIQTSGQQLIPDDNPRTVARWTGGLEELQRRRYVTGVGHKGEVFKVTREGYEAADALSTK